MIMLLFCFKSDRAQSLMESFCAIHEKLRIFVFFHLLLDNGEFHFMRSTFFAVGKLIMFCTRAAFLEFRVEGYVLCRTGFPSTSGQGGSSTDSGEEQWVFFEVADTGVGIAPKGLKALFREIVQVTHTQRV